MKHNATQEAEMTDREILFPITATVFVLFMASALWAFGQCGCGPIADVVTLLAR